LQDVQTWWRADFPRGRRISVVAGGWSIGVVVLMLAAATDVHALGARLRWIPSAGAAVTGYDVFVRQSGQSYGSAIDAGLPAPDAVGTLAYDVGNLVDGVTYYFSVTARGADGARSACAGEIALGNSDACLVDRCCPGEACTFGSAADGTPCDGTDACRLCRAAACTTATESPLDTLRLRLASLTPASRLNVSGTFIPADVLDPAADGLTLSVFDAAGTVLLTASVPPDAMRANAARTWFALARDHRDGALRILSLRVRRGEARVRARLMDAVGAVAGPLGWAIASGRSCGRSAPLTCAATPRGLSCG
jgi:hypothetical protein